MRRSTFARKTTLVGAAPLSIRGAANGARGGGGGARVGMDGADGWRRQVTVRPGWRAQRSSRGHVMCANVAPRDVVCMCAAAATVKEDVLI